MGCVLLAACADEPAAGAQSKAAPYVLMLDARPLGAFVGRGQDQWAHDVVSEGLSRARWFKAAGEGTELSARLRYEERRSEDGVPVLRVHLVVEPDPGLEQRLASLGGDLEAYVELERRDHTIDLRRDLPVAVERAIAIVDAKVTVITGTTTDVAALLADDDPEVVLVVLDAVEQRRLQEVGDAVYALLDHDDERVGLRAVECLGIVGRPEHAPGLLRAVRLADRAHANRLYEALANLGGSHARGFLEFAARNEEDPELASLAIRALARLESAGPVPRRSDAVARGHRQ